VIKLESAHIEEVHGIRSLDLDFQKSTFAISGPNGSGKSGVIDAIEFALTGSISRLMGRGTKGLSVAEHGPHVDKVKFPDAAFVRAKVFLTDLGKSATITRKIKTPTKVTIEPADPDTLKGVGKVYVQVIVDVFCSLAFAKVYTAKMPVTAADLLYDRVLPFYEALGVKIGAILTDNGREFCGLPEKHPYELLLAMEDIEHRTTKVRNPRTNGFVERMNRTLLDECFRVQGRQTWYIQPDEIQRDLDTFMRYYNLHRSHQGYRLKGRTPAQALTDALGVTEIPEIAPNEEVTEPLPTAA